MTRVTHYNALAFVLAVFLFAFPSLAIAAQVSFKIVPSDAEHDAVTIIEAYLDSHGSSINALEGTLGLFGSGVDSISSIFIETGGSIFSLWPVDPAYSKDEHVIRFAGGSPQSTSAEGLLFRMRITSEQQGNITLSWIGGSAYIDDGFGTTEGISARSLVVALPKNIPNQIRQSSPDSVPPYFEELEVSRDPDVFDGKYFVSFHANDDMSGIARYEVIEGQAATETTQGTYVFLDQERLTKTVVVAYDKAGNSSSIKVPTRFNWLLEFTLAALAVVAILVLLLRRTMRSSS